MFSGIIPNQTTPPLRQANIQNVLGDMLLCFQPASQSRWQLRIDQKARHSGSDQNWVIQLRGGKLQTGSDRFRLQKRIIRQNLRLWHASRQ